MPSRRARFWKLAGRALRSRWAALVVVGEQQLDDNLPHLPDLLRVCADHHAVGRRRGARATRPCPPRPPCRDGMRRRRSARSGSRRWAGRSSPFRQLQQVLFVLDQDLPLVDGHRGFLLHAAPPAIASNLQTATQAPHLVQRSWSISCGRPFLRNGAHRACFCADHTALAAGRVDLELRQRLALSRGAITCRGHGPRTLPEVAQRGEDRIGGGLAEAAEGALLHHGGKFLQQCRGFPPWPVLR